MIRGDRAKGLAHLSAAAALDPTVICEDWHLVPLLRDEGRSDFRERMQERLKRWYHAPISPVYAPIASLSDKYNMRMWMAGLGIPLPRLFAGPVSLDDVPWQDLPADVVIKPVNASDRRGVILAKDGMDLFRQCPTAPNLEKHTRAVFEEEFKTPPLVLVEELMRDVDAGSDPSLLIPRDFKLFTAAGHASLTRMNDRNAPDGKKHIAWFDRAGRRKPPSLITWPEASPDFRLPTNYPALIAMAEHISTKLGWFLRLDFYLTPQGPVFGEFTTFPNAGLDTTPFSSRTFLQHWELWPD